MVLKADLHVHVEGAARPALVAEIAARRGIDLDGLFREDGGYAWTDFTSFLAAYDRAAAVFRSPEDYARLAEDHLTRAAREGQIYAELFVSPDHAAEAGLGLADHLDGLARGAARAEAATGIVTRFVPVAIRHLGPERAEAVAREVVRLGHPLVTGFGLAGDERVHHPRDFRAAFAVAREAGLGITAHAGEVSGPESVAAVLDHLAPSRIGHGIRAIEDDALVDRLAAEGIVLEVCPGSNVALGIAPSRAAHPFEALRRRGVKVTLGADDPPFFGTTIGAEYAATARTFALCGTVMGEITRTALRAAFVDEPTRTRLLARLDQGMPAARFT